MFNNWYFCRRALTQPSSTRPLNHRKPTFEPLEQRAMLTVLTVDIGDPSANAPGDNLYGQIQEAVDVALPGDKIKIHAGTYKPFVVNTDNLTITEAKRYSNPVVDGDLHAGNENGVEINANGVTVRGLTVQNADGSFRDGTGDGFLIKGNNNTFIGNRAIGNADDGFSLRDSDSNTFKSNKAIGNNDAGFSFTKGSDGNSLKSNTATENGNDGFSLRESNGNMLRRNYSIGNTDNGFSLTSGSDGNTLKSNKSSGNADDGFFLSDSSNNTLTQNWATGNSDNGFSLIRGSDDNELKSNLAMGNMNNGFSLTQSDDNTLMWNWSKSNETDGFAYNGSDDNTTVGNFAYRNGGNGFSLSNNSDNNQLERNMALQNGGWGIMVDAVMANVFTNNFCFFNSLGGSNQPDVC